MVIACSYKYGLPTKCIDCDVINPEKNIESFDRVSRCIIKCDIVISLCDGTHYNVEMRLRLSRWNESIGCVCSFLYCKSAVEAGTVFADEHTVSFVFNHRI